MDEECRKRSQSRFFKQYREKAFRLFTKKLGGRSNEVAEDLADELVRALIKRFETLEYDPRKGFRGYFKTSARRVLAKFYRERKRLVESTVLDQREDRVDIETRLADEFDGELVRSARNRVQAEVTPRDWEIFVALYETPATPEELAKRYGMKPNAVYTAKYRVIVRLRNAVKAITTD